MVLRKDMTVGVFMGGTSREREVSLESGTAVCQALSGLGYRVVPVVLNQDSLAELNGQQLDVAFIAMHGRFGEDGSLTRLLKKRGIPCTGSSALSCEIAMDKVKTKKILMKHGIPTPPFIVLCGDFTTTEADWLVRADIGYPCVVKPIDDGSSFGVSIAEDRAGLHRALKDNFGTTPHVLIERFIQGREITCSILAGRALPPIEVRPKRRFYDFRAKYESCGTEYILKPKMSNQTYEKVRRLAVAVHNAIGATALSRVDMILSEDNVPYVLEINMIPGLTSRSLLPKAARALDISFPRLCEMILELALERIPSYNYPGETSGCKESEEELRTGHRRVAEPAWAP
jgi:D-alanine-D-alanine ligase